MVSDLAVDRLVQRIWKKGERKWVSEVGRTIPTEAQRDNKNDDDNSTNNDNNNNNMELMIIITI